LTEFKSTKAPGQYSTGTGGQYSTGANKNASLTLLGQRFQLKQHERKLPSNSVLQLLQQNLSLAKDLAYRPEALRCSEGNHS
jgi:hypothetical protein